MILIVFLISQSSALFTPMQVHLSWTEKSSEMCVMWQSRMSGEAKISYRPYLCKQNFDWKTINAQTSRIDFGTEMPRYSYIHTAIMTDLQADCYYEYTVGIGYFWTESFVFSGRTPGHDINTSYKMMIFGDLGTHYHGQKSLNLMKTMTETQEILGIMHMGDIGYNLEYDQGLIGDKFLDMIKPIATTHAYMTMPGNHEQANNFTAYKQRFLMPRNEASQNSSYFYSLNIGHVHYICLNTNPFLIIEQKSERKTMINWLKDDLFKANNNRNNVPWIIILHHHTFYCTLNPNMEMSRKDCEVQAEIIRNALEDIYYENKVDLVLAGHVHRYERQASIYKNQTILGDVDEQNKHVNAKAPIYIVSGSAGNRSNKNDPSSPYNYLWTRFVSDDFGFGMLTMINKTTLLWEQFSSESDKMIDYVYIIKQNNQTSS
ncbi:hypothetical protein SteCoe_18334 [Stentor coeruleus]|uniref:Purple acid phosphatase n=1 Tax=Stentor coeruleus TaxID=5963 RepID=A0A1R2BWQ0_9CILI|nr:hypothetical protein SteCoe_18334 [Stentor coeruleus]